MKADIKQVSLWTMIKTRRWKWLEELFAAQRGRTLTLPALLDYNRNLSEEPAVRRKDIRITAAQREENAGRLDGRSRRLLPANLTEGQEVEALFMKVTRYVEPLPVFYGRIIRFPITLCCHNPMMEHCGEGERCQRVSCRLRGAIQAGVADSTSLTEE